jgi:hypothetical protein
LSRKSSDYFDSSHSWVDIAFRLMPPIVSFTRNLGPTIPIITATRLRMILALSNSVSKLQQLQFRCHLLADFRHKAALSRLLATAYTSKQREPLRRVTAGSIWRFVVIMTAIISTEDVSKSSQICAGGTSRVSLNCSLC